MPADNLSSLEKLQLCVLLQGFLRDMLHLVSGTYIGQCMNQATRAIHVPKKLFIELHFDFGLSYGQSPNPSKMKFNISFSLHRSAQSLQDFFHTTFHSVSIEWSLI